MLIFLLLSNSFEKRLRRNSLNDEFCSLANYIRGDSARGSYYLHKYKSPPLRGNPNAAFCSPCSFPETVSLPWCLDNRMVAIYKAASFLFLTQDYKAPKQEQVAGEGSFCTVSSGFFPHLMGGQPTNQLRHTGVDGQRDHLCSIFLPGLNGVVSKSYKACGKSQYHQPKFTTV